MNLYFTAGDAGCAGGGTCNYKPSTVLTDGQTYFWNINATNLTGASGWSGGRGFTPTTKVAPAAAPTQQSPTGTGTTQPTYQWSSVTDATHYALFVTHSGGIVTNQFISATAAGCSGGGTCSYTPAQVLTVGVNYNWNVMAWNLMGAGPWSSAMSFKAQ